MYKLYDQKSPIKFPNGKVWSVDELKAHKRYAQFFENQTILQMTEGEVLTAFYFLENQKTAFGITEEDPQKAFELVKAKMEEQAAKEQEVQADYTEVMKRIEEQDEALMELASLLG